MGVIPVHGLPWPVSESTILSTLVLKISCPSSGCFGVEMKICTLNLGFSIPSPSASGNGPGILTGSSGSPSLIVLRTSHSNLASSPSNDGASQW